METIEVELNAFEIITWLWTYCVQGVEYNGVNESGMKKHFWVFEPSGGISLGVDFQLLNSHAIPS